MKTRAIRGHHEYFIRGSQLTSMMTAIISIVKFIVAIVGIALMVFK